MPRPNLDEDIVAKVRQIHREAQGDAAGSFQEALDTVVQLAVENSTADAGDANSQSGWYPGKYAGMVLDSVLGDSEATSTVTDQRYSDQPTFSGAYTQALNRDPENTAFFKTHLDSQRRVTIPEAEADVLGFEEGDVLQVVAYKVE